MIKLTVIMLTGFHCNERMGSSDVKVGMDEKVENAKAKKVADHFRGGGFKAELIYGH